MERRARAPTRRPRGGTRRSRSVERSDDFVEIRGPDAFISGGEIVATRRVGGVDVAGVRATRGREPVRARDARDVRGGGVRGGRGVDSFHRAGRRRTRARVVRVWRVHGGDDAYRRAVIRVGNRVGGGATPRRAGPGRRAYVPPTPRAFQIARGVSRDGTEKSRARVGGRDDSHGKQRRRQARARRSIRATPPSAHRKGHERGGAGRRPPRRRRRECRRLRESRRLRGASEPEERPARRRPRRRAGRPSRERENEHDVEDSQCRDGRLFLVGSRGRRADRAGSTGVGRRRAQPLRFDVRGARARGPRRERRARGATSRVTVSDRRARRRRGETPSHRGCDFRRRDRGGVEGRRASGRGVGGARRGGRGRVREPRGSPLGGRVREPRGSPLVGCARRVVLLRRRLDRFRRARDHLADDERARRVRYGARDG